MGTVLKVLVLALGMDYWPCSGFPVYDYDPASLRESLSAAMAKVNSQSLSPYLFRAFRSSLKRVNVLDEDNVIMDLEFGIRETTCTRDSGADPSTCAFQRGYYMPVAACRGTVQLSARQVQEAWVHCHWASTSESDSSEEASVRRDSGNELRESGANRRLGRLVTFLTYCHHGYSSHSSILVPDMY
ncbi:Secreted phosphoprotein 24 [Sciurus carolinensis]|uniref:Secreted phosphoprotein 24 n=1 Tax=Sciurus carolinensis TaxID=30640 RepID=A0AA41TAI7_SCICA|nr:Secreted phosphoprotein 24 [Sciurus carolinensis]